MKDSTSMIKNMDMVHFSGQMEGNMSGTGKMESSMEGDNITCRLDRKK